MAAYRNGPLESGQAAIHQALALLARRQAPFPIIQGLL